MKKRKEEVKEILLDIVDGAICIIDETDIELRKEILKKSLHKTYDKIRKNLEMYTLRLGFANVMRKRHSSKYRFFNSSLICIMRMGFICSYDPFFIKNIDFKDGNRIRAEFLNENKDPNENYKLRLKRAIDIYPIKECNDYHHLVQAFEMMRNWIHDFGQSFFSRICLLELPINDERVVFTNSVFSDLASKKLKSIKDVRKLRRRIEVW